MLPIGVNIIALTATATSDTLDAIKDRLSMPHPIVIGLPPNRNNIFFTIWALLNWAVSHGEVSEQLSRCTKDDNILSRWLAVIQVLGHKVTATTWRFIDRNCCDMFNKACSVKKREVLKLFCKDDVLHFSSSSVDSMGCWPYIKKNEEYPVERHESKKCVVTCSPSLLGGFSTDFASMSTIVRSC